ncbi:selenocysteine-specific elongation factor [Erpetoichthys calabaricus]|uniref:Selenocysteine-specific elongation factor n=1 Tax=Erpetoichthys calabaricus TaxID=27687 RepID=A0A8C4TK04_ERPCA|nr:selenocysteine-specific elongation factor [Erpetoichthys calabaricus]
MASRTLNFNVGVLGHIDSGKTSLAQALSTTASTAAFDRNPQSRERGITLDLGFSSFSVPLPAHLEEQCGKQSGPSGYDSLQFTLVDCPGHASLIRTIIGGAQIIDLMMLVIDVVKGMQTQTAECLVIGEITCPRMVIVLNKTDLLPEGKRQAAIEKMTKRIQKTLENTRFSGCPVISVAAKPGGSEPAETDVAQGISELIELLKTQAYLPQRKSTGSFLMSVDHCFLIRGQGTVMTGTVLQGSVSLNDNIEIPALKVTRKVKSMQMFHKPVSSAMQGDRVGVCVTQFDPKQLERGLICTPDSLRTIYAGLISVKKISYFKGPLRTKSKFHITIGHETVMGRVTFFGCAPSENVSSASEKNCSLMSNSEVPNFDFDKVYLYQEEYLIAPTPTQLKDGGTNNPPAQWALLEFEKPVTCPQLCLVIGSKLDTDIHTNTCRLAFHGVLLEGLEEKMYADSILPRLKVYKSKSREGVVERVSDEYTVIGRNLFKKETNIQLFVGLKVTLSTGEKGIIEGGFGQSGKFKVRIPEGLSASTKELLSATTRKKSKGEPTKSEEPKSDVHPVSINLSFKKFVFDPQKKMVQT